MAKLWRVDDRWGRLSLVQQFVLGSLVVVLVSIAAVGWWVGNQIEAGVIHRTAGATALYVESFIGPQIQFLDGADSLSKEQIATLDRLLAETPLGQEIVTLKVWGRGGRVLYSTSHDLIGQQFAPREKGRRAWAGEIVAGVSNLEEDENVGERGRFTRLLEYYIPVRLQGTDRIVAVAEFYQTVDALEAETAAAQLRSWLVVGLATLVTYLLLIGIVRRGSDTISRQQSELNSKISQLTALLSQNEELRERVQRAATRTTELNERFLRRISAELHDGPAQDMSLALLRLDSARSLMEDCSDSCPLHTNGQHGKELETVQFSLTRALQDLRAISSGLRLPELEHLNLSEILVRVVGAHERRTSSKVGLTLDDMPCDPSLPTKITTYRLVQEALSNAYRHGGGVGQKVEASCRDGGLELEVSDQGPGFQWTGRSADGDHLGLVGMRERVESQGGSFRVETRPGRGTRVIAFLPMRSKEEEQVVTSEEV